MKTRGAILCALLVFLAAPSGVPGAEEPAAEKAAGEAPPLRWMQLDSRALEAASSGNRLILLYISAPWDARDHTLRTVTLADPRVRRVLDEFYVPVMVNTDERPDIFARYGLAAWPTLTVLLSDGQPLYHPGEDGKSALRAGGTFFSPESFVSYFGQMAVYYRENTDLIKTTSETTSKSLLERINVERGKISPEILEVVVGAILDNYKVRPTTAVAGAFLPDFEMVELAWYYWHKRADRAVLTVALNHLTDLARGGIHDRLGGGFFRFAEDALFKVPSFEKLPSTNAQAIRAYLTAAQITHNGRFLRPAIGALEHVMKNGFDPASGSFRGAMFAWTEDQEPGAYYTWTQDEFKAVLGEGEEREIAAEVYDIAPTGELLDTAPLRNVIFMASGPKIIAARTGKNEEEIAGKLEEATRKLREARDKRTPPSIDPTTYGDWSGMLASSLLDAAAVTGDEKYAEAALAGIKTLMTRCTAENGLVVHACRPGVGYKGSLSTMADQAQVAGALLDAYEWTGDAAHLDSASKLAALALDHFRDSLTGGFTDTELDPAAPGRASWPVRQVGDEMAMVTALLRLFHHTGQEEFKKAARKGLQSWADEGADMGAVAAPFALASEKFLNPPLEMLLDGGGKPEEQRELRRRLLRLHHPWRLVRVEDASSERLAALSGSAGSGARVYFCVAGDCSGPFDTESNLSSALADFMKGAASPGAPNP